MNYPGSISIRNVAQWSALALAIAGLTGCRTYNQQNKIAQPWHTSNLTIAEKEARAKAQSEAKTRDAIIWLLEEGAVLRAAGKLEDSNVAFDQAEDRINKYEEEAKTKIGNEAGALLSNQAQLPYRGRSYDGIMVNTYKALNYLQLGQPDKARVELVRAGQRQQDAVEDNKKRIEKEQEALEKNKDKEKIRKAQEDSKLKSQISSNYDNLDNLQPYGDYENPFAVYMDALFFMANASTPDDLERARKSFERVKGAAGENKYLQADLDAMQQILSGTALSPLTYVVFETGCAPSRDQIRIDVPTVVGPGYVGAAFPKLVSQTDYAPALTVTTSETSLSTETLASMDSVIGRDFKNELPGIITKTLISSAAKAAAGWAGSEAARQAGGEYAKLAVKLATAAYSASVNIADCRTWTTLPKEFQVARIATPADRKLEFSTPSGQKASTTLPDGTFHIVYVKSISANSPLLVSAFKLK